MVKKLLACAALLAPLAIAASEAFAGDQDPVETPDDGEKDLCNDLNYLPYPYWACSMRPDICFWDTSDNRCEWIYNRGPCSGLSYNQCTNTYGCFWDSSDSRCEPI